MDWAGEVVRRFADGGYQWTALRLWPTHYWLVWCVELHRPE